ncbi:hypothetical protein [Escherichia coli]|nr:hypothetical protein [Escherichia coli]
MMCHIRHGMPDVAYADKTRQRRIRHLSMVSDAARAPYPTYGSDL